MNAAEAKKMSVKLASIFPAQVNQEQAKMVAKEFLAFTVAAVDRAIVDHRKNPDLKDGFWNMGKLLEGCRAAERGDQREARVNVFGESLPDMIRRDWEQLRKRNDYEVLIRYWRAEWYRYSASAERRKPKEPTNDEQKSAREMWQRQVDGERLRVTSGCRYSLIAAGMDAGVVDSWVETIFSEPSHFQRCLAAVREMSVPAKQISDTCPV